MYIHKPLLDIFVLNWIPSISYTYRGVCISIESTACGVTTKDDCSQKKNVME